MCVRVMRICVQSGILTDTSSVSGLHLFVFSLVSGTETKSVDVLGLGLV